MYHRHTTIIRVDIWVTLPCLHIVHKNGKFLAEVKTLMWQLKKLYDKNQNAYLEISPHGVRICHHFYHMSYFRPLWGAGAKAHFSGIINTLSLLRG